MLVLNSALSRPAFPHSAFPYLLNVAILVEQKEINRRKIILASTKQTRSRTKIRTKQARLYLISEIGGRRTCLLWRPLDVSALHWSLTVGMRIRPVNVALLFSIVIFSSHHFNLWAMVICTEPGLQSYAVFIIFMTSYEQS